MQGEIRSRAAANCAGAYRTWAQRTGHASALWPDLSVADMGVAGSAPVDSACLLAPMDDPADLAAAVDRAEAVFAQRDGGPVQLWSAWPTPDLTSRGYAGFQVPGMTRAPGGAPGSVPSQLQVRPARTVVELAAAGRLIDEVFQVGASDATRLVPPELPGEDLEVFIGYVGDTPVATATAYVSDGLCGVYAVATAANARGRGYGEALSWAATMYRPDLPATLQASPSGFPIYRRMGYVTFGQFTVWAGPRPRDRTPGPAR